MSQFPLFFVNTWLNECIALQWEPRKNWYCDVDLCNRLCLQPLNRSNDLFGFFWFDTRTRCYDDIVFLCFSVTHSLRRSPVTDFHFRFEHPNGGKYSTARKYWCDRNPRHKNIALINSFLCFNYESFEINLNSIIRPKIPLWQLPRSTSI